jgi:Fe-S oxidoreductase
MVTLEEEHTTRGRANALRLALAGDLPGGLQNETLREALDLCLQCKACKTECPSNVDLAKLKVETLYQNSRTRPVPLGSMLMGHIDRLNPIGSALAPLANATLRNPAFKWLLEKVAGIDRRRSLPTFAAENLRDWFDRHEPDPRAGSRGSVVLLDDCFTTYNTPEVGRAAVALLEAAGYRVELAGLTCCGRPAISKGLLDRARDLARDAVAKLLPFARRGIPIVGCEPSCLLTLVDEYRDFRLGGDAGLVASAAKLVDAFLADPANAPDLPLSPRSGRVLLHGHCQQKAIVGVGGSAAALGRVPGLEVRVLDSSCCGMAGSFGYELGHHDVSVALGNRLMEPIAADPSAQVAAPGFSCRSQLHGLFGVEARHPVELLAAQLEGTRVSSVK